MKKILGLVALFMIIISSCFYFFPKQPKNIFDEIYQETERTYLGNNVFNQLKDVEVRKYEIYDKDMQGIGKYTPKVIYIDNYIPANYSETKIEFNFDSINKGMSIRFEWKANSKFSLWYLSYYNFKSRTLEKELAILEEPRKAGEYLKDEEKVRDYLKKYNITKEYLDKHYDEIVNQKVLKDWCTIYDSKYSPSNYGDVKVETQWENW
ncbi:TipC family immunity protein [Streptococcus oralis]|uniref:TipC family immunity protein n=2 Tax=Streptococcus oralis TaxID=1303 RepID=UPI001BE6D4AD|nr:TipC family immunity protein [Streptococcus oralis]MBT3115605.1 TipC family immunity protein [Streptococcus oralis]